MAELLQITSDRLRATINPIGAELWSLRDADGRELMTDADPRWWTGHAPILFPIVGRLNGDVLRLDGREYPMEKHGIARKAAFDLIEATAASVHFRLRDSNATRAAYPFAFALDIVHALDGATLQTTATVTNRDAGELPFSLGFHPAFAWPLPYGGGVADHRIIFAQSEPAALRSVGVESGLISPELRASPVDGDTLAPTFDMFDQDALIWDQLASRSLTWGVPGQPHLRIDFLDTTWLGLWQKPGAHYLCIEPWAGMADPVGYSGDFRDKPGMMMLEPGASRSFRLAVTLVDENAHAG